MKRENTVGVSGGKEIWVWILMSSIPSKLCDLTQVTSPFWPALRNETRYALPLCNFLILCLTGRGGNVRGERAGDHTILKGAPPSGLYSRVLGASPLQGLRARDRAQPRPPGPGRGAASPTAAHLRATPQLRRRGGPKARSQALLPAVWERVGTAVAAPLAKLGGTPTRSSGLVTYRVRSPAAAATASQPNRAAAAIFVRVRRRGTVLPRTPSRRSPAQAQAQAQAGRELERHRGERTLPAAGGAAADKGGRLAPGCLQTLPIVCVDLNKEGGKKKSLRCCAGVLGKAALYTVILLAGCCACAEWFCS